MAVWRDMFAGVAKLSPRGEKCERSHGSLGVFVKCEILVSSLRAQVNLWFHTLKVAKIFVGKVEVGDFWGGLVAAQKLRSRCGSACAL